MRFACPVGEPFPLPELIAQPGAGWHIPHGVLFACEAGIRADELEPAGTSASRIYLTASGPIMALLVDGLALQFEAPAGPVAGTVLPWWADPAAGSSGTDRAQFHLVGVDHNTAATVAHRTITVSPHFTATLRREALTRWAGQPLNEQHMWAASAAWRVHHPDAAASRRKAIASSRIR